MALDSTPEIIRQAKSGRGDAIVNAAMRRDLLRAQLAELDTVLEGGVA